MPRYKVTVLVHQHREVEIDAPSPEDAMRIITHGSINGEDYVVLVDAIDAQQIDQLMQCDTCGTHGTQDDAIDIGDECPHEWCFGHIIYRLTDSESANPKDQQ